MSKPVVLVIGSDDLGLDKGMSYYRDGFCYHLKETFGCETLIFDNIYKFLNAIEDVKFLNKTGRLVMALVIQDKHEKDEHLRISKILRKRICRNLPIVRIKNIWGSGSIRGYWFEDKKLQKLIKEQLSNFNPIKNYFGVETRSESNSLLSQLEKAYWRNYSDTISSTNDQVVFEALRLRLLPPELIKEEFDDALRNTVNFDAIQLSIFQKECKLIKDMSPEEREDFLERLQRLIGSVGGSCGDNVSALAIDPITLQYSISSGFGNHNVAKIDTAGRMKMAIRLKTGESLTYKEETEIEATILNGLIVKVNRFKTPILRIMHDESDVPRDVLMRIGQVFIEKRELIPVDWHANLLMRE